MSEKCETCQRALPLPQSWECSRFECPTRKTLTAGVPEAGYDYTGLLEEQPALRKEDLA